MAEDNENSGILISVVVPIFNEEMNVRKLYNRIVDTMVSIGKSYEIVFVNDGSRDASMPIIISMAEENSSVKYIDLSRNFGHQIAITAGIENAVGEYIVIMDGDGQDPPELIPSLFSKAFEGYEVVYAKRKTRQGETLMKKLTAKVFYRLLSKMTKVEIPLDTGDFRMIHRKIQRVLKHMPEQDKYLRGQIAWIGFNSTFVEYDREERMGGETKFSYSKMLKFAMDGVVSFSSWPLKLATIFGFSVSLVAFGMIIYSIYQKFFGYTIQGWTSLQISILFLGGVQLIGMGMLGEYVSRMSENVKNRPTYVVKNSNIASLEDNN